MLEMNIGVCVILFPAHNIDSLKKTETEIYELILKVFRIVVPIRKN